MHATLTQTCRLVSTQMKTEKVGKSPESSFIFRKYCDRGNVGYTVEQEPLEIY